MAGEQRKLAAIVAADVVAQKRDVILEWRPSICIRPLLAKRSPSERGLDGLPSKPTFGGRVGGNADRRGYSSLERFSHSILLADSLGGPSLGMGFI